MQLVINDQRYPLDNINEATLDDLMALRKATGLGIKQLRVRLQAMGDLPDPEDALDDPDTLLALGALVWLARRKAGETLTLEQACDFPLAELSFEDEPGVEQDAQAVETDPKSSPGSGELSTII